MGGSDPARPWRTVAAGGAVVVVVVALAWWARPPSRHRTPDPTDPGVADEPAVTAAFAAIRSAPSSVAVASEGTTRAWVCRHALPAPARCVEGRGADLVSAATAAVSGQPGFDQGALTLDVLADSAPARWPRDADDHEAGRFGLEVGPAVVLPWEVLGLGLFRPLKDDGPSTWDVDALRSVVRARGGELQGTFTRLRTVSWTQDAPDHPPIRLYRLHPWEPARVRDPAVLAEAARAAADHLASVTGPDGRIRYRYDPVADRRIEGQNLLRHAGSAYALVQAWQRFGDPAHLAAAERALAWLLTQTRTDQRQGPHGGGTARYVVEGKHVKLGGAALALVALDSFRAAGGAPERWAEETDQLATFLLSQQLESGEFVSFASLEPGGEKRDDNSAYYPGEAVLALVLHHELTGDRRWLEAAERGATWLGDVRDAGKGPGELPADHWFMIASDRLHAVTGDRQWLERGQRVAGAVAWQAEQAAPHATWHLDFAGGFYDVPRSTPSSIRAEGLAAVLRACRRAGEERPDLQALLDGAVTQVLWSQIRPETAFWVRVPPRAVGGVTGGVVDTTLRNDYTQHALSALLGAEDLLRTPR